MSLQKGMLVILNSSGQNCYQRNKKNKKIPPNKIMKIKSYKGFDSNKDIWEVEWNNITDYYFEYCLSLAEVANP